MKECKNCGQSFSKDDRTPERSGWSSFYHCKKCNSSHQIIFGDRMGGQGDTVYLYPKDVIPYSYITDLVARDITDIKTKEEGLWAEYGKQTEIAKYIQKATADIVIKFAKEHNMDQDSAKEWLIKLGFIESERKVSHE